VKVLPTPLAGLVRLVPVCHRDDRGTFVESWNAERYAAAGIPAAFVQDNLSRSRRGVLRGLHYQLRRPQGKLITVIRGAAFDVAVDLRRGSPTFGRWHGTLLSDDNHEQMWVPPGFAHGFLALADAVDVVYKVSAPRDPDDARVLRWDDPDVGVAWPLSSPPLLSPADAAGARLADAEVYP